MEEERKNLIEEKHKIEKELCKLEFKEKSYQKILEDLNILYILIRRTPLGKNGENWQRTIGVPINQFEYCKNNKILIIIGIMDKLKVDSHIFYVFDFEKDSSFLSGYTNTTQYINYGITNQEKKKNYLQTIEEYLDNIGGVLNGKNLDKTL